MITSSSLGSIKSTELFNFLQAHFNEGMLVFEKRNGGIAMVMNP